MGLLQAVALRVRQLASPAAPAAGSNLLYPKSDDKWYTKNSAGVETLVGPSGAVSDSGWIAPTLLNGWVNYGGGHTLAGYRKIGGVVYLRGLIKFGTATASTVLFVLPVGYRPDATMHGINVTSAADGQGSYNIYANGDVTIRSGANTYFSLDGIAFPAD